MRCILCLKPEGDASSKTIGLFTDEATNLNVRGIVSQHFWVQPKDDDIIHNFICEECWRCLYNFHQFYERIQQAHQFLTKCEKEIMVKIEQNDDEVEAADIPLESLKRTDALEEQPIDEIGAIADDNSDDMNEDALSVAILKTNKSKKVAQTVKNSKKCARKRASKKRKTLSSLARITRKKDKTKAEDDSSQNLATTDISAGNQQDTRRRNLTKFDDFIAENIKIICSICQLDCDNFTTLCLHFRNEHKVNGYVKCCGKKFLRRGILVDHLYTHKDPEYFKCNLCGKVLADRRCLEYHQLAHNEKTEPPTFKCEICSRGFSQRTLYIRHLENHTPKELRKFECSICAKKFSTQYYLRNHENIVHLNKYSRVCDICGKKIMGREAFRLHQATHEGKERELFNCNLCGAAARSKYGLGRHKRLKHNEDYQKPQQCKFCSKISPNKEALTRHINYMHNLKRTHKCSICDCAFKRSQQLKEHLSTHTGDILYFCTYCPKTFNSHANMYAHRKRIHPEEWALNHKEKLLNQSSKIEIPNVESSAVVNQSYN